MEIIAHQAIFGENNNRHSLICSSLNDKELLNELEFSTDRPLSTGNWLPYTTGFPLKKYYVLLRIASDKRPQQRSGWRIVHALIFQKQEVSHWRSLMQLMQFLPEIPIRVETLSPLKILEDEIESVVTPSGYSKLVSLLVKPTRTNKILVWVGNEEYLEAVCELWHNLWASVRTDISFTYSYRPQDVDTHFTLVSTPVEYIDQWRGYDLIRNTDIKKPSSDIERLLLGQGNIQHLEAFVQDAGIEQVALSKIGLIHQAYEYYSIPDWENSLQIVRPLARLIAEIVPDPKSGNHLKSRIIERLSLLTSNGSVEDILALRNFDPAPFQEEASFFSSTIKTWGTRFFTSFQIKHSVAIARLLEGQQPTNRRYWNESVNTILQSTLAVPSFWNDQIAETLWKVWIEKPALITKTSSFFGNEHSIENYLASTCPLKITENLGKAIRTLAVSKSWFRLHAAALAGYADIDIAFQLQMQIDTYSKYTDGMRELVTRYASVRSAQTVLNILLKMGDQRSLIIAGELCAQHPSLLQVLDLSDPVSVDIWLNAVAYKEDLLNSPVVSSKDIYRLIDAWLEGKFAKNSILENIGYSRHNDLTEYKRRSDVWRPLERISHGLVKSYLASTARGWLSRFWKGETWGMVVEYPLENAIKESSYLRELLASSDSYAIQFGLRFFSFLRNRLGPWEFREWFLKKQFYRKITPENAALVGKFIADNSWSYTSEKLAEYVERSPQSNWRFALEEYRSQLSERKWMPLSNSPIRYQIESESKQVVNVLFLATNPTDTTRLRLDKEHRAIIERLRLAQADKFIRTDVRGAVRPSDLQAYLLQLRPHVVHFSGHGDEDGRILLENENGKHQAVPIEAVTNLFRILKDNVQVILINACWSKAQAESLATNIDYVIGMSRAISDESAIRFAEGFYQGLGYGLSVRQAFDLGKNTLELHSRADYDVPQMLVRPGVDEMRPIFVPN